MLRAGRRNRITDVPGLRVGHAADVAGRSGTTLLIGAQPLTAAVDVRGGGPGTRETDLMHPACLVEQIDAIVLSGGSAFGLAAADGVVRELARQGRGFAVGGVRVPIVPAAILFDLLNGGDKPWLGTGAVAEPPYARLGAEALRAATEDFALGSVGAGLGAKAGFLRGGLGSASSLGLDGTDLAGLTVGALVAANPAGSVIMPGTDQFWAAPLALPEDGLPKDGLPDGDSLDLGEAGRRLAVDLFPDATGAAGQVGGNTTLGTIATDAALSRGECQRLAIMAQDGFARAIRPCHTPYDGDTVFAVSTGAQALPEPRSRSLYALGTLAADTMARAIMRAVMLAGDLVSDSAGSRPSWQQWRAERRR